MQNLTRNPLLLAGGHEYCEAMPSAQDLEAAFGARVDGAVDKVGGLLPVEWSVELRHTMRGLIEDAYAAGAAQVQTADAELRRAF